MGVAAVPIAMAAYGAYKGHKEGNEAKQAANRLSAVAKAPYEGMQGWLPPELRSEHSGPIIGAGMEGIGGLIRNPGQVSSQVSSALTPQLGVQSRDIAQRFGEEGQNQAGAAGANNLPPQIKAILQAMLGTKQAGAQQGATEAALGQTDQRKRADLEQTYSLLNTILQFISTGRGQSIPGLIQRSQTQAQMGQQNSAANMAAVASLLQSQGRG